MRHMMDGYKRHTVAMVISLNSRHIAGFLTWLEVRGRSDAISVASLRSSVPKSPSKTPFSHGWPFPRLQPSIFYANKAQIRTLEGHLKKQGCSQMTFPALNVAFSHRWSFFIQHLKYPLSAKQLIGSSSCSSTCYAWTYLVLNWLTCSSVKYVAIFPRTLSFNNSHSIFTLHNDHLSCEK